MERDEGVGRDAARVDARLEEPEVSRVGRVDAGGGEPLVEGGDPGGVGDGRAEVPRSEGFARGGRGRDVAEGAVAGGGDPGVGLVTQREEEGEELAQEALAGFAALRALAETGAFFGRARRSADLSWSQRRGRGWRSRETL